MKIDITQYRSIIYDLMYYLDDDANKASFLGPSNEIMYRTEINSIIINGRKKYYINDEKEFDKFMSSKNPIQDFIRYEHEKGKTTTLYLECLIILDNVRLSMIFGAAIDSILMPPIVINKYIKIYHLFDSILTNDETALNAKLAEIKMAVL